MKRKILILLVLLSCISGCSSYPEIVVDVRKSMEARHPPFTSISGTSHEYFIADMAGNVLTYNGKWSREKVSKYPLMDILAIDGNVWTTGTEGKIYYYDGSSWKLQFDAGAALYGINGSDKQHLWAVGDGIILFYDGVWKEQYRGDEVFTAVTCCGDTAWAVAEDSIYVYDAEWQRQYEAGLPLQDIYAGDNRHVWAVGDDYESTVHISTILFFDGSEWVSEARIPDCSLSTISGSGNSAVWAVNSEGRIFKRDKTWKMNADFYNSSMVDLIVNDSVVVAANKYSALWVKVPTLYIREKNWREVGEK